MNFFGKVLARNRRTHSRGVKRSASWLMALLCCSLLLAACGDAVSSTATAVPAQATATSAPAAPTATTAAVAPTNTTAAMAPTATTAAMAPTATTAMAPTATTASVQPTATAAAAADVPAEHVTLTWMIPTQQDISVGDSVAMQAIAAKFNVSFEFTEALPGEQYDTKKSLAIASQDIPDLMSWVTKDESNRYGPEGAFLDLTDIIATKLPNVKRLLDEDALGKYNAYTTDEKIYRVPTYNVVSVPIYDFSYMKNEFDAVGATQLDTWDQVYDALKKLKEKYPESYPFSFRGGEIGTYGLRLLVNQSFTEGLSGAPSAAFDDIIAFDPAQNGYIYGPTAPGFKEGIQFLAKLYAEKLLDPEYATVTIAQLEERLKNKTAFMLEDYVGGLAGISEVQAAASNELVPLPIPVPDGKKQTLGFKGAKTGNLGTVLNAQLSGAKLDRALAVLNYMYSQEFYDLLYWNPDVTVETNGVKMYNDEGMYSADAPIVDKYLPWSLKGNFLVDLETTTKPGSAYADYKTNVLNNPANADKYIPVPALPFTAEQSARLTELQTTINDYYNSQVDQFITGKKSFDDWDSFISEVRSKGADEMVTIYNENYTQYFK